MKNLSQLFEKLVTAFHHLFDYLGSIRWSRSAGGLREPAGIDWRGERGSQERWSQFDAAGNCLFDLAGFGVELQAIL